MRAGNPSTANTEVGRLKPSWPTARPYLQKKKSIKKREDGEMAPWLRGHNAVAEDPVGWLTTSSRGADTWPLPVLTSSCPYPSKYMPSKMKQINLL